MTGDFQSRPVRIGEIFRMMGFEPDADPDITIGERRRIARERRARQRSAT